MWSKSSLSTCLAFILLTSGMVAPARAQEVPADDSDASIEIRVHLLGEELPEVEAEGSLTAVRLDVRALEITVPFGLGESVSLDLPPGQWRLSGELDGYWVESRQFEVGSSPVQLGLDVWPAGRLEGRIVAEEDSEAVRWLQAFFRPVPGSASAEILSPGRSICEVAPEDGELLWNCLLPATKLDVRFQVPEFVPRYVWGVDVPVGEISDLGDLTLLRGAGVQGWVVDEEGNRLGEDVELELIPESEGSIRDSERAQSLRRTTRPNDRGFFQLAGVPPGRYRLEGRREGFAPSRVSVEVIPGQMTEVVDPPLVLHPPRALEGFVVPALHPSLDQWSVRLAQLDRAASRMSTLSDVQVAADGSWSFPGLSPGRYLVTLLAPDETKWLVETVDLEGEMAPLFLEVDPVSVEGEVTLGGVGLAEAELFFGGRFGAVRVDVATDEDGGYNAVLPRDGDWEVELFSEEPRIRRLFAKVEIVEPDDGGAVERDFHLPETFVFGEVVNEDGEPLGGALIEFKAAYSVELNTQEQAIQIRSRDDGSFEIVGARPGPALIGGTAPDYYRIEAVDIEVLEDEDTGPLELVARREVAIPGLIGSAYGGVAGAWIKATPVGPRNFGVGRVSSDPTGRFTLWVPVSTRELRLSVGALGFAFRMLRVPLPENGQPVGIQLLQESGELTVTLPRRVLTPDLVSPMPFVFHNQSIENIHVLYQWAYENGVDFSIPEPGVPTTVTIPAVEPGNYRLCWVLQQEIPHVDNAVIPESRCTGGYLAPGGNLRLELPEL